MACGQGFGASEKKTLRLKMEGQLSNRNRTTILDIDNGEIQKQATQEVELNNLESKMKRTESEEECNDFKNAVKGRCIIALFGTSSILSRCH